MTEGKREVSRLERNLILLDQIPDEKMGEVKEHLKRMLLKGVTDPETRRNIERI